ncbi:MAG: VWA domain-containing protein [Pseudomonadota bacterium]
MRITWSTVLVVLYCAASFAGVGCGEVREGSGLCLFHVECHGTVLWCFDYNGYVSYQERCPCACTDGRCDDCLSDAPVGGILPGTFTTDGGTFQVSVTPVDEEGKLIYENLTVESFSFHNLVVRKLGSGGSTPVCAATAWPVDIDVTLPESRTGDTSTSIGLLLDSSGSMSDSDPAYLRVDASTLLLEQLRDRDRAAVLDFGAGTTEPLECSRILQEFTGDENALLSALEGITADGGTPLYCASLEALDHLAGETSEERILLVLTDGDADTGDEDEFFEAAIQRAQDEEIVVYTVGLGYSVEFERLQEFAQETGGTFGLADEAQVLAGIFQAIGVASSQGWVVVHGKGTFEADLEPGGYVIEGQLRTTIGTMSVDTPFQFTIHL